MKDPLKLELFYMLYVLKWEVNLSFFYSHSLYKMKKDLLYIQYYHLTVGLKGEHSRDVEYRQGEICQPLPSL